VVEWWWSCGAVDIGQERHEMDELWRSEEMFVVVSLLLVLCDVGLMEQVIWNLCCLTASGKFHPSEK
jgi:hypothetical protein